MYINFNFHSGHCLLRKQRRKESVALLSLSCDTCYKIIIFQIQGTLSSITMGEKQEEFFFGVWSQLSSFLSLWVPATKSEKEEKKYQIKLLRHALKRWELLWNCFVLWMLMINWSGTFLKINIMNCSSFKKSGQNVHIVTNKKNSKVLQSNQVKEENMTIAMK